MMRVALELIDEGISQRCRAQVSTFSKRKEAKRAAVMHANERAGPCMAATS